MRHEILLLVAVVLAAAAARATFLLQYDASPLASHPIEDEAFYDAWARARIADGPSADPDVFHMSPAPARWLEGLYRLGIETPRSVRVVHAGIGVLGVLVAWATTRVVFGARSALAASALLAVYAPAIFYEASLLPIVATVPLASGALGLVVVASRRLGAAHGRGALFAALGAGLSTGLLVLLRGNALVLAAALALYLTLLVPRRKWLPIAYLAGFFLPIVPITAHNVAGGELVFLTWHGGQNLWIGNHEGATGLYLPLLSGRHAPDQEREDAVAIAERDEGRRLSPREVDAYWRARAFGFVRESPGAFFSLLVEKTRFFFSAQEFPDAHDFYYARDRAPVLRWLPGFGLLLPLALAGVVLGRSAPAFGPVALGFVAYTLSVVAFFVFGRYRLPVLAFMIPLAALGVVRAVELFRARRVAPLLGAGLVAAIGLAVAYAPTVPRAYGLASTYVNEGIVHELDGAPERARRSYARAIELNPRHAKALRALVRLDLARGVEPARLAETAERALAADSTSVEAWLLVGEVCVRSGRLAEAREAYRGALRLAPGHPDAVDGIGRIARRRLAPRGTNDVPRTGPPEP